MAGPRAKIRNFPWRKSNLYFRSSVYLPVCLLVYTVGKEQGNRETLLLFQLKYFSLKEEGAISYCVISFKVELPSFGESTQIFYKAW